MTPPTPCTSCATPVLPGLVLRPVAPGLRADPVVVDAERLPWAPDELACLCDRIACGCGSVHLVERVTLVAVPLHSHRLHVCPALPEAWLQEQQPAGSGLL